MKLIASVFLLVTSAILSKCDSSKNTQENSNRSPKETRDNKPIVYLDSTFQNGTFVKVEEKYAVITCKWGTKQWDTSAVFNTLVPQNSPIILEFLVSRVGNSYLAVQQNYGLTQRGEVFLPLIKGLKPRYYENVLAYDSVNDLVCVFASTESEIKLNVYSINANLQQTIPLEVKEVPPSPISLVDTIYFKDKNLFVRWYTDLEKSVKETSFKISF